MTVWRLVIREICHRKLSFLMGVISVTTAVACLIGAQALLRLGRYLKNDTYWQAGLTVTRSLFAEPYLSTSDKHQGLILHAVYHRPNGWDTVPAGGKVPSGEACMWGDYHAMELAAYLHRVIEGKPYLTFWS